MSNAVTVPLPSGMTDALRHTSKASCDRTPAGCGPTATLTALGYLYPAVAVALPQVCWGGCPLDRKLIQRMGRGEPSRHLLQRRSDILPQHPRISLKPRLHLANHELLHLAPHEGYRDRHVEALTDNRGAALLREGDSA